MKLNLNRGAAATAAFAFFFSLGTYAGTPGWYFGVEGGASFLDDADNRAQFDNTIVPGEPGEPGSPGEPGQPGEPGEPGGGLLVIPGLIVLFPTPSTGGEGGSGGTPGEGGSGGTPGSIQAGENIPFSTDHDTGFLGGITAGHLFENGFRAELELRYSENDIDTISSRGNSANSDGKLKTGALMANLFYDFNRNGRIHPYIGGGVGGARVEVDGLFSETDEDYVFAYQGGAGLAFDITDRLTADLGYRYLQTDDASFRDNDLGADYDYEYTQQAALLSLRYTFFATGRTDSDGDGVPDDLDKCPNTPEGAPVDANGCPLDSDGDGVPDYLDNCPNTPAGTPVGADGCPLDADGDGVPDHLDECPNTPAGAPVDAKGCPLDSDGDGVPDYLDDCPNTPAGAVVDARGCPTVVDSDGDGVPDDRDKCPDTPAGVRVTADGCAVGQGAILEGVNYEFNSAKLTSNAERILDDVVQTLKDSPGFGIELSGHTDSIGSDAYNQELSQLRAESARRYLIDNDIAASRIEAIGFGESRPIAPNTNPDGTDNPEGRAKNRRTEFKVLRR